MSDRNTPKIFATVFEWLAGEPYNRRNREFAKKLMKDSMQHDFCSDAMECDDALLKLGLAKRGFDPRYCNEGEEMTLYLYEDYDDDGNPT